MYQKIVTALDKSRANREKIIQSAHLTPGGDVTEYLNDLEVGGFIEKESTWNIISKHISKLSQYRLSDNYTRFYLRYILPNKDKIKKGQLENISINNLPGWNTILALQFENLVINNSKKIFRLLSIKPEDIIQSGPFFQRKTDRQPGCQIDYMIQTKHDVVYVFEIKFKRDEIKSDIIAEVQEKLERLSVPKYISRRTVLIHVNGVKDEVIDAEYFSSIIDFSSFLTGENF
jgi:hypothetical protein